MCWLKPLDYALIFISKDGYPCVFYGDYYGANYKDEGDDGEEHEIFLDSHQYLIDKFLHARHAYSHGYQKDYFDHEDVVGWTRMGDDNHPGGMAVVMSNGDAGVKHMDVGYRHRTYIDLTGHIDKPVTTNERGCADFRCNGGSVSVWVPQDAEI